MSKVFAALFCCCLTGPALRLSIADIPQSHREWPDFAFPASFRQALGLCQSVLHEPERLYGAAFGARTGQRGLPIWIDLGRSTISGTATMFGLATQGTVCNSALGVLSTTTSTNCPGVIGRLWR